MTVRTFPAVLGLGTTLAIMEGGLGYLGGDVTGIFKRSEVDLYERKEQLRRDRRRPLEETLEEMGEGRGTHKEAQSWREIS